MDFYKGTIPIIDGAPDTMGLMNPVGVSRGYVERDYSRYPQEMLAAPDQIQLIPESEDDARFDEAEAQKSSLEHIYLGGPNGQPIFENLDQNGDGYCWIYSNGHAVMIKRAANNLPLIRLNPHSSGAIIKSGRNEGGWCGLGAKFIRDIGMAEEGDGPGQWPLHSRNLRYDTQEMRTAASRYRTLEDWVDLTKSIYDQNLTTRQLATCLMNNNPCPTDFSWWRHSVCSIRWVRIERGSWGLLILNSWKNWGRFGLGVLRGNQSRPDGAVCLLSTTASSRAA